MAPQKLSALSMLVLIWAASFTPAAKAAPAFCSAPLVRDAQRSDVKEVKHHTAEIPTRRKPSPFDALLFQAMLREASRPREAASSSDDFAPILHEQFVRKAWAKLGTANRQKILDDKTLEEKISDYDLLADFPKKTPFISASVESFKTVLAAKNETLVHMLSTHVVVAYLLAISKDETSSLAKALAYVCSLAADVDLKEPKESEDWAQKLKRLDALEATNAQIFEAVLDRAFHVDVTTSLFSLSFQNFLAEVRNLDLLFNWSDPSADFSKFPQLDTVRKNSNFLSVPYRDNLAAVAKAFLLKRQTLVGQTLAGLSRSLERFQRLTRTWVMPKVGSTSESQFLAFGGSEASQTKLKELEQNFELINALRKMASPDSSLLKKYLSLFYFEDIEKLGERLAKTGMSGESARIKGGNRGSFRFKARTLDRLVALPHNRVFLFPWMRLKFPHEAVIDSDKQRCEVKSSSRFEASVRCSVTNGFSAIEKSIAVPQAADLIPFSLFLDQLIGSGKDDGNDIGGDGEAITEYLELFDDASTGPELAFMEILKSARRKDSDAKFQEILDKFEDRLALDDKKYLNNVIGSSADIDAMNTRAEQFVDKTIAATTLLGSDGPAQLNLEHFIPHLSRMLLFLLDDAEKNGAKPLLQATVRRFFTRCAERIPIFIETTAGPKSMTLKTYAQYLLLHSANLEQRMAPKPPASDERATQVDDLARRWHKLEDAKEAPNAFTKTYLLHRIFPLAQFYKLGPRANSAPLKVVLARHNAEAAALDALLRSTNPIDSKFVAEAHAQFERLRASTIELKKLMREDVKIELAKIPRSSLTLDQYAVFQEVLLEMINTDASALFQKPNYLLHLLPSVLGKIRSVK